MRKNSEAKLNYKLFIKKFLPLIIFIAATVVVLVLFGKDLLNIFSKPENIKSYIESKGNWGVIESGLVAWARGRGYTVSGGGVSRGV